MIVLPITSCEEYDGSHSYDIIGNNKIEEAVDMAKNLFGGANSDGRIPISENEIVKQKYFGAVDTLGKSQKIFDIIADNVEFTFVSIYAPQLNDVLKSCWRDIVTDTSDLGATSAEDAFLLDQATYEMTLEEIDDWFGLR